ncbi:hypothetical protein L3X38_017624 [Prunus dulcis]|uniref:MULE transposase domain-containing protein n=1 Tax=Prunus dulcis TaxID=3755 RepID=A0AAD4W8G9_PRUDU|nr:hypothetical protein L3X38_017624 [Prunus dulcis]
MEYEFRSGGKTPKYATNGMCTLELHHGGWFKNGVYKKGKVCYLDNIIEDFLSLLDLLKIGRGLGYDVDNSQVEQRLEIRGKIPEGRLELVTSDAIVVKMVGHIPSNKVIVLYCSEIEDYEYDADAENCDGDLTHNYQVKDVDYIEVEDEETFENVGTKVWSKRKKIKLPKFKQYRRDVDLKNPEFRLGMKFANKKLRIEAIKEHAIIHEQLKIGNKGSTVKIKTQIVKGETVFQKIYVCLAACKEGFLESCRLVIGVDGCHLKGPYPGQILTAVGVDGSNGFFLVAYAVVDIESKDSWIWFFNLLIEDLGITNRKAWVVISDKQKGLVPAIETILLTAEHRMCVRHLYSKFRASHIGLALKHILWATARAAIVPWWEAEMEKMKNEDEEAWKWLKKRPAKH